MPRALLVSGGDAPSRADALASFDETPFVCAADSGFDTVRAWGMLPDLVVGDMDSIADPGAIARSGAVETLLVPREKDETDTELGFRILRERGYDDVTLAGGGGGRLDHLLAIRCMFEREAAPTEWVTHAERVFRVAKPTLFRAPKGSVVSVFPLGNGASGMKSAGLTWKLDGLVWKAGDFGVSNVAPGGEFSVDPGAGRLLVVLPLAGLRLG